LDHRRIFCALAGINDFPNVHEEDIRKALPFLKKAGVPYYVHAELEQNDTSPVKPAHMPCCMDRQSQYTPCGYRRSSESLPRAYHEWHPRPCDVNMLCRTLTVGHWRNPQPKHSGCTGSHIDMSIFPSTG
jgi:hypothetical protein